MGRQVGRERPSELQWAEDEVQLNSYRQMGMWS